MSLLWLMTECRDVFRSGVLPRLDTLDIGRLTRVCRTANRELDKPELWTQMLSLADKVDRPSAIVDAKRKYVAYHFGYLFLVASPSFLRHLVRYNCLHSIPAIFHRCDMCDAEARRWLTLLLDEAYALHRRDKAVYLPLRDCLKALMPKSTAHSF